MRYRPWFDDVGSDRQTVGSIAQIFDSEGSGPSDPHKIIDALDAFGHTPVDDNGLAKQLRISSPELSPSRTWSLFSPKNKIKSRSTHTHPRSNDQ